MKSRHWALGLTLAIGVVTSVSATQLNQHGANFAAYNAGDVGFIDFLPYGVRSLKPSATTIIASADHNPAAAGQTVIVDGYHNGSQTTALGVYSYNFNGTLLAFKTVSAANVSGWWERSVSFSTAESPIWAYYSVIATIPGSGSGVILGVTATP